DKDGRYRLNAPPYDSRYGEQFLHVKAPAGLPYVSRLHNLPKARGGAKRTVDIALPRGVLVRGKITEKSSGKPVGGAAVYFYSHEKNNDNFLRGLAFGPVFAVASGTDGTFELVVLPGPGRLAVEGPQPEYVLREIAEGELQRGQSGGGRWYAHAVIPT